MSVAEQGRVFLAMCLCGAALGAVYDALYLLRCAGHGGAAITGICDLAFGVCCAAGMTCTALVMQVNPMRWYEFAGVLCGMGAYRMTMGTLVRNIQKAVGRFVKKVAKKDENREFQAGKNGIGQNDKSIM